MSKVYIKRGKKNYKENNLIKEINQAIEEKYNGNVDFEPARNFNELKDLHSRYAIDDVEYEEVAQETTKENISEFNTKEETQEMAKEIIDPLVKENPKVRDYVLNDSFGENNNTEQVTENEGGAPTFEEPLNMDDAFEIPEVVEEGDSSSKGESKSSSKPKNETSKEPANPKFDTMSTATKNKQTERFSKAIVNIVCNLAKLGFEYWGTSEITPEKIEEYEAEGLNLDILLTLEGGQQATVKQFFEITRANVKQLAEFSEEEKKELADALGIFMKEKGFTPTPTQGAILSVVSVFGEKAIGIWAINNSIKGVITQLRDNKQEFAKSNLAPDEEEMPMPEAEVPLEDEEIEEEVNTMVYDDDADVKQIG